ncbi:uncharacterized protein EHS24_005468 [Apiotrichum porosum]|uniref:Uncharacterized protein n=1 Tax=Apiotrichum porosum TaxID=105984 RepID=A0A427XCU6_9TREE|nr:uncharacterized protein EHS24_005468 [Apiotrichum porosum]RSH76583.1 hypothetical protein EHS24_005468 [Apiotrichum porosum]
MSRTTASSSQFIGFSLSVGRSTQDSRAPYTPITPASLTVSPTTAAPPPNITRTAQTNLPVGTSTSARVIGQSWQSWVNTAVEVCECHTSCADRQRVVAQGSYVCRIVAEEGQDRINFPLRHKGAGETLMFGLKTYKVPLAAETTTFHVHKKDGDNMTYLYDVSRGDFQATTTTTGTDMRVVFDTLVNYLNDLRNAIQATSTARPPPFIASAFGTAPHEPSRRKRAALNQASQQVLPPPTPPPQASSTPPSGYRCSTRAASKQARSQIGTYPV